jgi:hypothetical protein
MREREHKRDLFDTAVHEWVDRTKTTDPYQTLEKNISHFTFAAIIW